MLYSASFCVQLSAPGAPFGQSITTLVCAGSAAAASSSPVTTAAAARAGLGFA